MILSIFNYIVNNLIKPIMLLSIFNHMVYNVMGYVAYCYCGWYRELFASNNLIDIRPTRLAPTWRNDGRSGPDAIDRRLDRFLVADGYLSSSGLPSSWVEHPFFSDHAPILLQLRPPATLRSSPFKFDHHWLTTADYNAIVLSVWRDPCFLTEENAQLRLVWKLKNLKIQIKIVVPCKEKSGTVPTSFAGD
jgi:hypothetical protein